MVDSKNIYSAVLLGGFSTEKDYLVDKFKSYGISVSINSLSDFLSSNDTHYSYYLLVDTRNMTISFSSIFNKLSESTSFSKILIVASKEDFRNFSDSTYYKKLIDSPNYVVTVIVGNIKNGEEISNKYLSYLSSMGLGGQQIYVDADEESNDSKVNETSNNFGVDSKLIKKSPEQSKRVSSVNEKPIKLYNGSVLKSLLTMSVSALLTAILLPFVFLVFAFLFYKTSATLNNVVISKSTFHMANFVSIYSRPLTSFPGPYKFLYNKSRQISFESKRLFLISEIESDWNNIYPLASKNDKTQEEDVNSLKLLVQSYLDNILLSDNQKITPSLKMGEIASLTNSLDFFLGHSRPVVYLFVFFDSTVQRPSGGVLSEVSVVTVSKSEVVDIKKYLFSDIENSLKGEISFPKHLVLDGTDLTLKDFMYRSDFRKSAEEIISYVDKAYTQEVDFVVGVDIAATDTANPQEFLDSFLMQESAQVWWNNFIANLQKKSILIYSPYYSDIFNALGWSGGGESVCTYCAQDYLGIYEFQESGFKQNYFVELSVKKHNRLIKKTLTYYLDNQSSENYKSFVFIKIPANSSVSEVEEISLDSRQFVTPIVVGEGDSKEVGINVSVLPGNQKALRYEWETSFDSVENYEMKLIRPIGLRTLDYQVTFEEFEEYSLPDDFLTDGGAFIYNGQLLEDKNFVFTDKSL